MQVLLAFLFVYLFAFPVFAQSLPAKDKAQEVLAAYDKVNSWEARYESLQSVAAVEKTPEPGIGKSFPYKLIWSGTVKFQKPDKVRINIASSGTMHESIHAGRGFLISDGTVIWYRPFKSYKTNDVEELPVAGVPAQTGEEYRRFPYAHGATPLARRMMQLRIPGFVRQPFGGEMPKEMAYLGEREFEGTPVYVFELARADDNPQAVLYIGIEDGILRYAEMYDLLDQKVERTIALHEVKVNPQIADKEFRYDPTAINLEEVSSVSL
jgi:outer membrane lipoprotein-sorting protein